MKKEDLIESKIWIKEFTEGEKQVVLDKLNDFGFHSSFFTLDDGVNGIFIEKEDRELSICEFRETFEGFERYKEIFWEDLFEKKVKDIESDKFKIYFEEENIFIHDKEKDIIKIDKKDLKELIKLLKEVK